MSTIEEKIISLGLGENGLPVMARMGDDPGFEYFRELLSDLKELFNLTIDKSELSKEISYPPYCIGHCPYVHYTAAMGYGKEFRGDFIDP